MRRFFIWCGVLCTMLFGVGLFYSLRMDWVDNAGFDVTGFLWLMQNFPRVAAIGFTFSLGVLAIYCFVAAVRVRSSAISDEGTERRFAERFGPHLR